MPQEAFLAEASAIADQLVARAVFHGEHCTWLIRDVPERGPQSSHRRTWERPASLRSSNASIGTGTAGLALLLASVATYTDDRAHKATARAAIQHALSHASARSLWKNPVSLDGQARYSFFYGPLGVAYGAIETSRLLDDPSLMAQGVTLLNEVSMPVSGDFENGQLWGRAGAIVALLAIPDQPLSMEFAVRLGHELLQSSQFSAEGRSWKTQLASAAPARNLLGFGYGAAGIGLALSRLYQETRDVEFAEAAAAAFQYERNYFDSETQNWPCFRLHPTASRFPSLTAWCHGAAGVGLSRVLVDPKLQDAALRQEARTACSTSRAELDAKLELPGSDFQFCHGISGLAECLWRMEQALEFPGADDQARAVGMYGIERFGQQAQDRWGTPFGWPTAVPHGFQPTLLHGLGGIANFLLRLHDPAVPAILVPGSDKRP